VNRFDATAAGQTREQLLRGFPWLLGADAVHDQQRNRTFATLWVAHRRDYVGLLG
jgi:hypothetical protein